MFSFGVQRGLVRKLASCNGKIGSDFTHKEIFGIAKIITFWGIMGSFVMSLWGAICIRDLKRISEIECVSYTTTSLIDQLQVHNQRVS